MDPTEIKAPLTNVQTHTAHTKATPCIQRASLPLANWTSSNVGYVTNPDQFITHSEHTPPPKPIQSDLFFFGKKKLRSLFSGDRSRRLFRYPGPKRPPFLISAAKAATFSIAPSSRSPNPPLFHTSNDQRRLLLGHRRLTSPPFSDLRQIGPFHPDPNRRSGEGWRTGP